MLTASQRAPGYILLSGSALVQAFHLHKQYEVRTSCYVFLFKPILSSLVKKKNIILEIL